MFYECLFDRYKAKKQSLVTEWLMYKHVHSGDSLPKNYLALNLANFQPEHSIHIGNNVMDAQKFFFQK